MKKLITAVTAIMVVLLFATPQLSIADNWYVGGTLHHATVREWQEAKYENKLATAVNWTLLQPKIRKVSRRSSSMETVRPYVIELVACVDKASIGESYADKNVSSLAAACMASMGW